MEQGQIVHPGPRDPSLLHLQHLHVSKHVWNGHRNRVLRVRQAQCLQQRLRGAPRLIREMLRDASFLGVLEILFFQIDHQLISALVERWRPETHTFHKPIGECTITLEDVGILLGLPVDDEPVTGIAKRKWREEVLEQLGVMPEGDNVVGGRIKMKWLDQHFGDISVHQHSQLQLQWFTRAYILRMLVGFLFADHSGIYAPLKFLPMLHDLRQSGTYSWGSAVLSYLYWELCKVTDYNEHEMGGAVALIQLWAWQRFPFIAPIDSPIPIDDVPLGARWIGGYKTNFTSRRWDISRYREKFDKMKKTDIVWNPYTAHYEGLPVYCFQGSQIWRSVVPLICFHIIEWHQSDRILRQF